MRRTAGTLAGIFASLAVLPALGIAIRAADPIRDLTLDLASDHVALPTGAPVVLSGTALDGTDLARVRADIDGIPLLPHWTERTFGVPLPALSQGSHVLRMGIVHRGGLGRFTTLPVVVGPFEQRGEWINKAIEVTLASHDIDDRNDATRTDLASAFGDAIMMRAGTVPVLGAVRSVPIQIEPNPTCSKVGASVRNPRCFLVRGTARFARGSIEFEIPLGFSRPSRQQVAIRRTGGVAVREDSEARAMAARQGSGMGALLGGFAGLLLGPFGVVGGVLAGAMIGGGMAEDQLHSEAHSYVERMVDRELERLSAGLTIPGWISLHDVMPGTWAELRFHRPPRWRGVEGIVIEVDARVVRPVSVHGVPGPLRLGAPAAGVPDGRSHLRISPSLIAELIDAYSTGGYLAATLNQSIAGSTIGPLRVSAVSPKLPLLVERGLSGGVRWSLPDLAALVATSDPDAPTRHVSVFLRGDARMAFTEDSHAVAMSVHISDVALSCRDQIGLGWRLRPCLSDAALALPDLPKELNRRIPKLMLFGDTLAGILHAPLGQHGALQFAIRPENLQVGDTNGEPGFDVAGRVEFRVEEPAR